MCRFLYWILYLSLCFISGWFASKSGVLDFYFTSKTSFYLDQENSTKRPVITINLIPVSGELPLLNNNTWIHYTPSYQLWPNIGAGANLSLGENSFLIKDINRTEKVFLGQIGSHLYPSFRIIPLTNLLEEKATANTKITTLNSKMNLMVYLYLTSLENSLGSPFVKFKDGDYLQYKLGKDSCRQILIKPNG